MGNAAIRMGDSPISMGVSPTWMGDVPEPKGIIPMWMGALRAGWEGSPSRWA